MKDEFLFVYGTLRRDVVGEMYRLLARYSDFVGEATYQGKLYKVTHYPGVVPSNDPADLVQGEVYRIRNPDLVRVSYFETVLTIDLMGARGRPDHFSIT